MSPIQWLIFDIIGLRRDKRISTCRRWRWGRLIGWALAIGVWAALWAIWWVIPV